MPDHTDKHGDKAWFAPKQFGYGAGLPIAWQGWVVMLSHIAAIIAVNRLLHARPAVMVLCTIIAALLPIPLYAAKTRGGWKWRSGRE